MSVAGVAVDARGRVLIIQRRDNGHWEAPGGVLDRSETPEEGVVREVLEGTGVRVRVERLTGVYKKVDKGVLALVYRCTPQAGDVGPTPEAAHVEWLPRGQIDTRMAPAYAIRVHDAFGPSVASRAHDGRDLSTSTCPPPP